MKRNIFAIFACVSFVLLSSCGNGNTKNSRALKEAYSSYVKLGGNRSYDEWIEINKDPNGVQPRVNIGKRWVYGKQKTDLIAIGEDYSDPRCFLNHYKYSESGYKDSIKVDYNCNEARKTTIALPEFYKGQKCGVCEFANSFYGDITIPETYNVVIKFDLINDSTITFEGIPEHISGFSSRFSPNCKIYVKKEIDDIRQSEILMDILNKDDDYGNQHGYCLLDGEYTEIISVWIEYLKLSGTSLQRDRYNHYVVFPNGTLPEPSHPDIEGHTFEYWYKNISIDEPYDFSTPITRQMGIRPKFLGVDKIIY